MKEAIEQILAELEALKCSSEKEVEEARIRFLGKKGSVTRLFEEFRTVAPELKREFGQKLNLLKKQATERIESLKESVGTTAGAAASGDDLTMPADPMELGSRHPVSIVRQEIVDIFRKVGYDVAEGPEVEDDWHVFEALNFPPDHPARDMQDTFFVSAGHPNPLLLRTHTSSVQVRMMETLPLPIRVICPGRVFRNEAISARAHLPPGGGPPTRASPSPKHAILMFAREMFGADTQIRMRPSYFPFTEPSSEVDVSCNICKGKGCNICKGTGWLEIMGCGMVDPNVLRASGIDPTVYSGFAFGMGVERIAMLKWQVNDLRHYFENDMRFLGEFATAPEV